MVLDKNNETRSLRNVNQQSIRKRRQRIYRRRNKQHAAINNNNRDTLVRIQQLPRQIVDDPLLYQFFNGGAVTKSSGKITNSNESKEIPVSPGKLSLYPNPSMGAITIQYNSGNPAVTTTAVTIRIAMRCRSRKRSTGASAA